MISSRKVSNNSVIAAAIAVCGLVLVMTVGYAVAGEGMVVHKEVDATDHTLAIYETGIAPPLGYFVLIRAGSTSCALKFLEYGENSGKRYRYALYDWHVRHDGSARFIGANVRSGKGKATWRLIPFIGRLSFQTGDVYVNCGGLKVDWVGETFLSFIIHGDSYEDESKEKGLQIAPTKWKRIEDVNMTDRRIEWYTYTRGRKTKKTDIEELW